MLTMEQFDTVYRLLDHGMTESDCGVPCQQFCRGSIAVKSLLPGEEPIFRSRHPEAVVLHEPWYSRVVQETCCCRRPHRMFVCRAFPFRPVLDAHSGAVVDLAKVQHPDFAPCWVIEPLPAWRRRAIHAWRIVLDDEDNRRFFSHMAYLNRFLDFLGERARSLPDTQLRGLMEQALSAMTPQQEQAVYRMGFPNRST